VGAIGVDACAVRTLRIGACGVGAVRFAAWAVGAIGVDACAVRTLRTDDPGGQADRLRVAAGEDHARLA
jgi:hypothetical protein